MVYKMVDTRCGQENIRSRGVYFHTEFVSVSDTRSAIVMQDEVTVKGNWSKQETARNVALFRIFIYSTEALAWRNG